MRAGTSDKLAIDDLIDPLRQVEESAPGNWLRSLERSDKVGIALAETIEINDPPLRGDSALTDGGENLRKVEAQAANIARGERHRWIPIRAIFDAEAKHCLRSHVSRSGLTSWRSAANAPDEYQNAMTIVGAFVCCNGGLARRRDRPYLATNATRDPLADYAEQQPRDPNGEHRAAPLARRAHAPRGEAEEWPAHDGCRSQAGCGRLYGSPESHRRSPEDCRKKKQGDGQQQWRSRSGSKEDAAR